MTREKFEKVRVAVESLADVVKPQRRQKARFVADELYRLCHDDIKERKKNSMFFVYLQRVNYGNNSYPEIIDVLSVMEIKNYRETEKSFIDDGWKRIYRKDHIVGWLS